MFGLLNVNKPPGPTSHDVVARVRRMLPKGSAVGHAGTLDPFADGVLVLCLGPATRLAEYLVGQPKEYLAEVTLGAVSPTDDPEGPPASTGVPPPPAEQVRLALPQFVGHIEQTPPAYSAVHVDGRRAYKIARGGQAPEMAARQVRIDAIELLSAEGDRIRLRVECGGGTYIRAIARDLGQRLGCGGFCSALTRTRVGPFRLADAVRLDDLDTGAVAARLLPPLAALADWPVVTLSPAQVADIRQGKAVAIAPPCPSVAGVTATEIVAQHAAPVEVASPDVAAIDSAGQLVAICHVDSPTNRLRPTKVFPPA